MKEAILWKFATDDENNIQKNRLIAEQILPDAIQEADDEGVDIIGIQAVHRRDFLLSHFDLYYGYVWDRGKNGNWVFHEKK